MSSLDTCSLKKLLPILIFLLLVAQIDLASAAGWPSALLTLLHLTPAPDGYCRGMCAGLGTSLDIVVILRLARIWAKHAMGLAGGPRRD